MFKKIQKYFIVFIMSVMLYVLVFFKKPNTSSSSFSTDKHELKIKEYEQKIKEIKKDIESKEKNIENKKNNEKERHNKKLSDIKNKKYSDSEQLEYIQDILNKENKK